jgi:hypothetical protein
MHHPLSDFHMTYGVRARPLSTQEYASCCDFDASISEQATAYAPPPQNGDATAPRGARGADGEFGRDCPKRVCFYLDQARDIATLLPLIDITHPSDAGDQRASGDCRVTGIDSHAKHFGSLSSGDTVCDGHDSRMATDGG